MKIEEKDNPGKALSSFSFGATVGFHRRGEVYLKSNHLDIENQQVLCVRLIDGYAMWVRMESEAYPVPLKAVSCDEDKP